MGAVVVTQRKRQLLSPFPMARVLADQAVTVLQHIFRGGASTGRRPTLDPYLTRRIPRGRPPSGRAAEDPL